MHIVVILKDGFIDRSHAIDRIIPEHDGIHPVADQSGNITAGFRSARAGAILTPVGKLSVSADKGEFEQTGPGEGRAIDCDLPAVADDGGSGLNRNAEKEKSDKGGKDRFHVGIMTVIKKGYSAMR